MSDTAHETPLLEVEYNFRNFALHDEHNYNRTSGDGIGVFVEMQRLTLAKAISGLIQVVRTCPVNLTIGSEDLRIHNPLNWDFEQYAVESDERGVDEEVAAAQAFYAKTVTLEGGSVILLEDHIDILAPGDSTTYPYFGSSNLKRFIQAQDIAKALHACGKLSLAKPNI